MSDLIDIAGMHGIDINVFTTGLCGSSASFEPFERLARDTCGHMFKLPSSNELLKLKEFTNTVVRVPGATCLATGEWEGVGERRKRSVSKSSNRIVVDDWDRDVHSFSDNGANESIDHLEGSQRAHNYIIQS